MLQNQKITSGRTNITQLLRAKFSMFLSTGRPSMNSVAIYGVWDEIGNPISRQACADSVSVAQGPVE